jgi:hypothetical protein
MGAALAVECVFSGKRDTIPVQHARLKLETGNYPDFVVTEASPLFEMQRPRRPSPGHAGDVYTCFHSSF